eukprot:PhM_4_TR10962/c2_g1_i2/m.85534
MLSISTPTPTPSDDDITTVVSHNNQHNIQNNINDSNSNISSSSNSNSNSSIRKRLSPQQQRGGGGGGGGGVKHAVTDFDDAHSTTTTTTSPKLATPSQPMNSTIIRRFSSNPRAPSNNSSSIKSTSSSNNFVSPFSLPPPQQQQSVAVVSSSFIVADDVTRNNNNNNNNNKRRSSFGAASFSSPSPSCSPPRAIELLTPRAVSLLTVLFYFFFGILLFFSFVTSLQWVVERIPLVNGDDDDVVSNKNKHKNAIGGDSWTDSYLISVLLSSSLWFLCFVIATVRLWLRRAQQGTRVSTTATALPDVLVLLTNVIDDMNHSLTTQQRQGVLVAVVLTTSTCQSWFASSLPTALLCSRAPLVIASVLTIALFGGGYDPWAHTRYGAHITSFLYFPRRVIVIFFVIASVCLAARCYHLVDYIEGMKDETGRKFPHPQTTDVSQFLVMLFNDVLAGLAPPLTLALFVWIQRQPLLQRVYHQLWSSSSNSPIGDMQSEADEKEGEEDGHTELVPVEAVLLQVTSILAEALQTLTFLPNVHRARRVSIYHSVVANDATHLEKERQKEREKEREKDRVFLQAVAESPLVFVHRVQAAVRSALRDRCGVASFDNLVPTVAPFLCYLPHYYRRHPLETFYSVARELETDRENNNIVPGVRWVSSRNNSLQPQPITAAAAAMSASNSTNQSMGSSHQQPQMTSTVELSEDETQALQAPASPVLPPSSIRGSPVHSQSSLTNLSPRGSRANNNAVANPHSPDVEGCGFSAQSILVSGSLLNDEDESRRVSFSGLSRDIIAPISPTAALFRTPSSSTHATNSTTSSSGVQRIRPTAFSSFSSASGGDMASFWVPKITTMTDCSSSIHSSMFSQRGGGGAVGGGGAGGAFESASTIKVEETRDMQPVMAITAYFTSPYNPTPFLTIVTPVIARHRGIVHSYHAGMLLATWTRSKAVRNPCESIVHAAIDVVRAVDASKNAFGTIQSLRIGIDRSHIVSGTVGSPQLRMFRELRGPAVEGAIALTVLCEKLQTSILLTDGAARATMLPVPPVGSSDGGSRVSSWSSASQYQHHHSSPSSPRSGASFNNNSNNNNSIVNLPSAATNLTQRIERCLRWVGYATSLDLQKSGPPTVSYTGVAIHEARVSHLHVCDDTAADTNGCDQTAEEAEGVGVSEAAAWSFERGVALFVARSDGAAKEAFIDAALQDPTDRVAAVYAQMIKE